MPPISDRLPKPIAALLTLLGILVVAVLDYASGIEVRIYPLYYLPVAFAAWYVGRSWTLAAATLSTVAWAVSNNLAGLHYSTPGIWVFNAAMHTISFVVVGLLLAQLKTALTQEKLLSRLDPLTSLMNARAFHEAAARVLAVARRKKQPVTVAYIDLDDFKGVNDTHGHHEGDEMLRRVAAAIRGAIRISDVAARVGGDEFVLLLPDAGPKGARISLERLRGHLGEALEASPHPLTASIGAVVFATVPAGVDAMVQAADRRMYIAKAAGKDRIVLDLAEDVAPAPPVASGHMAE